MPVGFLRHTVPIRLEMQLNHLDPIASQVVVRAVSMSKKNIVRTPEFPGSTNAPF